MLRVVDLYPMRLFPAWMFFGASLVVLSTSQEVAGDVVRRPVPPQVMEQARKAVQAMGLEVLKENYGHLYDTMYGPWRVRKARALGGENVLREKIAVDMPAVIRRNGMQVTKFTAGRPTSAFEVRPVMKGGGGVVKEVSYFREWLVFVPTTRQCRIVHEGQLTVLESTEFQVAIATQGKNDWTFINGSGLSMDELRSMFPTLPATKQKLGLPKVGPFVKVNPSRP